MKSRGFAYALGTGARKSLVLLWTAVLLCSLLLQYAAIAAPSPVLAVHDDGLFELDGNVEGQAAPGDDWNQLFNGGGSAGESLFVTDAINGNADKYFSGGDSKDISDIPDWLWTTVSQPQDKNDIEDAYAAAYKSGDNVIAYFGLDRYASNGAAQVGFWFLQDDDFGLTGGPAVGAFSGEHVNGDVLVQINFENGGANPVMVVYEWQNGLKVVSTGGSCATAANGDSRCAIAATSSTDPAWSFDDKGSAGASNDIPAGGMVEGGIDLTALGLDEGCFNTFVAETRSSPSADSTLSDFALGSFPLCAKPTIETHVKQGDTNVSVINKGESVTDVATLTGDRGPVTGSVEFFTCFDADAKPDCSNGGTSRGTKALSGGSATSDPFTPANIGFICFRVEYTPAEGSKYLAASHTNQTSECVQVIPAEIDLTKIADDGSVSAGSPIGFTLTILSKGPGSAAGVKVSDTLPTKAGLDWSIDAAGTTGTWSIDSGVLSFGGANGVTMAQGASFHVHITSPTTPATCGAVDNTGNATTTNDGTDSASASIMVRCPDVKVTKTPDGGTINAGETATFSIKVENVGTGTAKNVTLTDNLPGTGQVHWTESEADCSISGADGAQVLSCTVGDLAPDASKTYTVSANLAGKTFCGKLDNSATAVADNEKAGDTANNTDTGDITVQCASIDIEKVADAGSVSAGDKIGFTITVTSGGPGVAKDVTVTDTLPTDAGTSWTIDGGTAQADCSITAGVLSCTLSDLASGQVRTVHISSPTTKATVADSPVSNTAHVSTSNDGSDDDTDQVVVLGPDVRVDKNADNSPISAGDKAAFTIEVKNIGVGIARAVTLSDTLPAGIEWTTDTDGCSIDSGTLTCSFGDLDPDQAVIVKVSGETDVADCGSLPNTASAASTNEVGDRLGNNEDSATILVLCPAVAITKTPVDPEVNATDQIAFDVVVTNTGDGNAFGVTVSDSLPTDAGLSWTIDAANSDAGWTIDAGVLKFGPATLASKASVTVRIVSPTTAATCPDVHNVAFLTYIGGSGSDDGDITVDCPDVKVTKTADNSPISAGEKAAFTITVENIGEGTAYDVTLADTLPAGVTWSEDSDDCSIAGGVLSCSFGDLDPQEVRTVHVSGSTTPATCGELANTATAAADNEGSDVLENNTDSDTVDVQCADVTITKVAVDDEVSAGDGIAFDIVVTNGGAGTAFNVTVNDSLPVVAGVSWSIDAANSDVGWTIDGTTLKLGPASLAAGASVKVRITSPTTAASCGDIDNTAHVSFNGGEGQASDEIVVDCPDVVIEKTADNSPILAGQVAAFTISVWNDGEGTAHDVQITDTLPAGINWTADNDACDIAQGVLTCDVGTLGRDDEPFTVTVRGTSSGESCADIPNQATVSASNEPEDATGNNTDGDEIDVQCASISLVKTAGNAANGAILTIPVPGNVTFTYRVTNTGTATLETVNLVDDNATPANTADDVTVTCPNTSLAPGESMDCSATLAVTGTGITRTNVAVVTAHPELDSESTVSAHDDAVVKVPAPVVTPRPTPKITPPPTSTLDEGTQSSGGTGLLLVLLGIAGLMLVLGYVMPAPAKARSRRRNRRG
jgi:uncharacterized repeat protein (TIGR01451 family)